MSVFRKARIAMGPAIVAGTLLSGPAVAETQLEQDYKLLQRTGITVKAEPVAADALAAGLAAAKGLAWGGGLVLSSEDERFGGISGMDCEGGAPEMQAVTDQGNFLFFYYKMDDRGFLSGLEKIAGQDMVVTRLLTTDGRDLPDKKSETDSEAITALSRDRLLISFERHHRINLYAGEAVSAVATPPELQDAPDNGGIEAMEYLADGRLLVLAEEMQVGERTGPDGTEQQIMRGWIRDAGENGAWTAVDYITDGGYLPTDLTQAPDGRIFAVERAHYVPVIGVRARLRELSLSEGETLEITGQEMVRFGSPDLVDNFEGLCAVEDAAGVTWLMLVSDDNFNRKVQKTLLYRFRLTDQ